VQPWRTCWPRPSARDHRRRGAVLAGAGPALRRLGELSGAILATSAVANGLFEDDPFAVGISGGFATPLGQRLLAAADVIVAFGASLNVWTTRHGALVANATLVQVDRDAGGDRGAPAGRPRARRRRARGPPRR
jgi:thiamine pyrophosphate-dependent acetolactate synthase large subunit-like protein